MEARAGYPILMWETLTAKFATTICWGWNPSQNGNDLGMVYGFGFTTLMNALSKFGVSFFVSYS